MLVAAWNRLRSGDFYPNHGADDFTARKSAKAKAHAVGRSDHSHPPPDRIAVSNFLHSQRDLAGHPDLSSPLVATSNIVPQRSRGR